jgi:hypothetical protein
VRPGLRALGFTGQSRPAQDAPAPLDGGGRQSAVTLKTEVGCGRRPCPYRRPMNATVKITFDVYRQKADPTLRIAVAPEARLPEQFKAKGWTLMARGTSPVHSDASRDIGVKGYCYFQVAKAG